MPVLQICLNSLFLLAGILIKLVFFVKKGLGRTYLRGIGEGIGLCFSREGRRRKVRFRTECLGNYVPG